MANTVMFIILAVVILGSAVFCVTTTRIMRAATFLLFVLLGVAGLYFLLDYTYLGAAQIAVYAGGVTMLYVFAIQLVGKRSLQNCTFCNNRPDTPYEIYWKAKEEPAGDALHRKKWRQQNYQHKEDGRIRHQNRYKTGGLEKCEAD